MRAAKKRPTHAQRQSAANAKAAVAISAFEQAAATLEEAAQEQRDLAAEALVDILEIEVVRKRALDDADSAQVVADKIRGLIS